MYENSLTFRIKIFKKEYQFSNEYLFEIKKYYRVLTISRALLLLAFWKFSFHFRLIRHCKYKVYKKTILVPALLGVVPQMSTLLNKPI